MADVKIEHAINFNRFLFYDFPQKSFFFAFNFVPEVLCDFCNITVEQFSMAAAAYEYGIVHGLFLEFFQSFIHWID